MTAEASKPRRLDESVEPSWVGRVALALRGGGIAVALLLLFLGFVTGGFFLLLTGTVAVVAVVGGFLLARFVERESWYRRPNAPVLSTALAIGLPLALITFAQIAGGVLTPPPVTSQCFAGQLGRGQERQFPLPVDPRIATMEGRVTVPTLVGGAFRWWFTDPVGHIAWGGRAEEQGFSETRQLEPSGGQWTVNVVGEADQAEYRIEWHGARAGHPMGGETPTCP
ncbi:MAG: hypothetical protein M3N29_01395 [Chloroflexota bacterium]|nr:hypothetical protein [Chloroflexota bacterium]